MKIRERRDADECASSVAADVNLPSTSVQSFYEKKPKIARFAKKTNCLTTYRRTTRQRNVNIMKMEDRLIRWIQTHGNKGSLNALVVQSKAKSIFRLLVEKEGLAGGAVQHFAASRGWYYRFSKRVAQQNLNRSRNSGVVYDSARSASMIEAAAEDSVTNNNNESATVENITAVSTNTNNLETFNMNETKEGSKVIETEKNPSTTIELGKRVNTKIVTVTNTNANENLIDKCAFTHENTRTANLNVTGSMDSITANLYPEILQSIIEEGDYLPEQVFSCTETGLYWKKMPRQTFISKSEESSEGFATSKDRFTVLLCINASGDFKLKPMVVYHSETPSALSGYDKSNLPVIWKTNKMAWVTQTLFLDWFKNNFEPAVNSYCRQKNIPSKALLILDYASCHPGGISNTFSHIQVIYLPRNSMRFLQPMDQGIVATFKAKYLKMTFRRVIKSSDLTSVNELWREYNIMDAIVNIRESWDEMVASTINYAWRNIWPECTEKYNINTTANEIETIVAMAKRAGIEGMEELEIKNLLKSHSVPLSDEELVQLYTQKIAEDDDEDDEDEQPKLLTIGNLTEVSTLHEKALALISEIDPDKERSMKVCREIREDLKCYSDILESKLREKKTIELALNKAYYNYLSNH